MGCRFWRGRPFYGRAFPGFGDVGRGSVGSELVVFGLHLELISFLSKRSLTYIVCAHQFQDRVF